MSWQLNPLLAYPDFIAYRIPAQRSECTELLSVPDPLPGQCRDMASIWRIVVFYDVI